MDYQIALNMASNGDFARLTIPQGEKLVENLAQSEQISGKDYDRTVRETRSESKGDDQSYKELNDKFDNSHTEAAGFPFSFHLLLVHHNH
ncbi:unnamed protein product [Cochlearia groenlandica]